MFFRQVDSPGLAHRSYYLAHDGEAIVIDPRRDVDVYLELARRNGDRVRYVLETHRNEDYVIGSTALAAATGASILHGKNLDFEYGEPVQEGDEVGAGRLRLRTLETPGHTDESVSYALVDTDTATAPIMVFTGDALFVGTTGRTDLYGPDEAERLARALYESLFGKILPLGDHVLLYPAHGSGSVCGSGMIDRDASSLGIERKHNPGLDVADRDGFVQQKLTEQHVQPPYFRRMEEWNRKGNAPVYGQLPFPPPLSPSEFAEQSRRAYIMDLRMPQAFAGGHIPGSYNLWMGGLSGYLGWIVPPGEPVAFVLPQHADLEEVARAAFRLGYDDMVGYLRGGFDAWQNDGREVSKHGTLDTHELLSRLDRGEEIHVIDVRKPDEVQEGTLAGAQPIFVGDLERRLDRIPRGATLVSMCSVGHRGGLGASILSRHGFEHVYNYLGGYAAWQRHAGEEKESP